MGCLKQHNTGWSSTWRYSFTQHLREITYEERERERERERGGRERELFPLITAKILNKNDG